MNWPWHSHKWQVVGTHYTPPVGECSKIEITGHWAIRRATEGVTNVYQKCSVCGLLQSHHFMGKFEERA